MVKKLKHSSDHSAGGVVYYVKNGQVFVLLILDPYGNWTFPKGHPEGDETDYEAAIREIREETGVRIKTKGEKFETVAYSFENTGGKIQKTVTYFLFRISGKEKPIPAIREGIKEAGFMSIKHAIRKFGYKQTDLPLLEKLKQIEKENCSE